MRNNAAANPGKPRDSWYYTIANFFVFVAALLFIIVLLRDAIYMENITQFNLTLMMGTALVLLMFIIQVPFKDILDAAFYCPFLLYLIFSAIVIIIREGRYFFTVYLGVCCIAAVYNNRRRLGQYLLATNIINIIFIYFRIPLATADIYASYSELAVHEAIALLSSILLYLIVRFVSYRGLEAVRTTETFMTLMDVTPMMIVIVDGLNCITHISKSMAKFAHIEEPDLTLGRPVLDLFRNMDVKLMIGDMLISEETVFSVKEIEINGEARHFSIVSSKLGDNTAGRFIYLDDVTNIDRARIGAEQATMAKSRFLATMSHEIRTSMNAIIGMSDLMPTENLSSLQKGYFEDIKRMSKSLLTIINDILDFSKIEAGKLELIPTHYNIHTLFDNIALMGEFIAHGKSLEFRRGFDRSIPEILYGDEIRVRQIFTNIINNAIKYTKEGSVTFSVFRTRRMADAARDDETEYFVAEIKDTGIGIKEEDITKLFGAFQQLDIHRNRGIIGTGLGLAITKNLVSMMNGHIEVESAYGSGSTFTVYLPLIPGDPDKVEHPENIPLVIAKEGVRVLVVDDLPLNLTVALGFLSKHNINAETAAGGFEAIEKIMASVENGCPYNLVFMDHMMPDLDGTEAAKRIRALGEEGNAIYQYMPIVALSANAVKGAEETFLAAGMNGFVSKPIEPAALNAALNKFLPEGTCTLLDIKPQEPAAEKPKDREESVMEELSNIKGLDIEQGLYYAGKNFETYTSTLKQLSVDMGKGISLIKESLVSGDWKPYTIQAHAYSGICATIGAQALSDWGKKLEAASKGDDKSACLLETESFCSALEEFNAALSRTSLFAEGAVGEKGKKTEIGAEYMAAKLEAFVEACDDGRSVRVKAVVKELEGLCLAGGTADFEVSLAEALNLARAMDYDEAAETARGISGRLKNN